MTDRQPVSPVYERLCLEADRRQATIELHAGPVVKVNGRRDLDRLILRRDGKSIANVRLHGSSVEHAAGTALQQLGVKA